MTSYSLNHVKNTLLKSRNVISRPFFNWVLDVFNSVDRKRIEEVGPDRACAEWLLKNGASVKWKNGTDYLKDYNYLIENDNHFFIESVDASDSGIYYKGFRYFAGCQFLKEIVLNRCVYIDDRAMKQLCVVKDTLTCLEIQDNANITSEGLCELKILKKLQKLILADMKHVEHKEYMQSELQKALPNCNVEYH